MSLTSDVIEQIANGVQYLDDIAAITGYSNKQIYDVCKAATNKGVLTKVIPGINGAFVIKGHELKPRKVTMQAQPQTVTAPAIAGGFDFNASINQFVSQMTQQIVEQIKSNVAVELAAVNAEVEKRVSETVRISSEGVINNLVNQLSQALGGVKTNFNNAPVAAATVAAVASEPSVEDSSEVKTVSVEVVEQQSIQKPPAPMSVAPQKCRLPKVLVTNLLPVQCGLLTEEFGQTFDLIFWNDRTGSSAQQLREYAQSAAVIFWHVKHSSHSSEAIARKHNQRLVRVKGDMTAMRAAIQEYYNTNYASRSAVVAQ